MRTRKTAVYRINAFGQLAPSTDEEYSSMSGIRSAKNFIGITGRNLEPVSLWRAEAMLGGSASRAVRVNVRLENDSPAVTQVVLPRALALGIIEIVLGAPVGSICDISAAGSRALSAVGSAVVRFGLEWAGEKSPDPDPPMTKQVKECSVAIAIDSLDQFLRAGANGLFAAGMVFTTEERSVSGPVVVATEAAPRTPSSHHEEGVPSVV